VSKILLVQQTELNWTMHNVAMMIKMGKFFSLSEKNRSPMYYRIISSSMCLFLHPTAGSRLLFQKNIELISTVHLVSLSAFSAKIQIDSPISIF
jgi:hypothetical protein